MENDSRDRERELRPYSREDRQYDEQMLEEMRLTKLRRQRADQLAKDRLHAEMIMVAAAIVIVILIILLIVRAGHKKQRQQEFLNSTAAQLSQQAAEDLPADSSAPAGKTVPEYQGGDVGENGESPYVGQAEGHSMVTQNGITYVDGIMIVNKTFSLPSDYSPGLDKTAKAAFDTMATAAWGDGISIWICSGFRTYKEQEELFDGYAAEKGLAGADEVSARPGHSEHQSGLCMDVNSTEFDFAATAEAQWLDTHCAEYGFIIRFPLGKESITGYAYEPWHIRYVGVEAAQAMKASGVCLEEYLGVTSDYNDSLENESFIAKYAGMGSGGASSDGITSGEGGGEADSSADDQTDAAQQGGGADDGYGYDGGYYDGNDYGYGYDYGYGDYGGDYGYNEGYSDYNYDGGYSDYGWGEETYY